MIYSILISSLGIFGAILLARDAFFGIRRINRLSLIQKNIKNYIDWKNGLINNNEKLRLNPYPENEIVEINYKINSKYNDEIKKLEEKIIIDEFSNSYKNFKYGIFGLLLLVLSFGLQIISSYHLHYQISEVVKRMNILEDTSNN